MIWILIPEVLIALFIVYSIWKLQGIFSAFDKVILKTLTDTTMIDKHNLLIHTLSKYSETSRNRIDKEYSELRSITKALESDVRALKSVYETVRKDR